MVEKTESNEEHSSAASQALMVPELLESIFLELPLTDLLTKIPRVCKHWQATIEGSIKLQSALFFKPASDIMLDPGEFLWPVVQGTDDLWAKPVFSNPFVTQLSNDYFVSCGDASRLHKGVDEPQASWRRMLVTQPPMTRVTVHSHWCACISLDRQCWKMASTAIVTTGVRLDEAACAGTTTPKAENWWSMAEGDTAREVATELEVVLRYAPAEEVVKNMQVEVV